VSFLKELVEDFRRDAQNAVSSVADALGSNDYPALRAALHALEGSSRELGALGILRGVKQLKQIKPFELGSSRAQLKLEQLRSAVTTTSQLLSGYAAQTGEERAL
jgi:two-component system sensor histidine kinase RpfC